MKNILTVDIRNYYHREIIFSDDTLVNPKLFNKYTNVIWKYFQERLRTNPKYEVLDLGRLLVVTFIEDNMEFLF